MNRTALATAALAAAGVLGLASAQAETVVVDDTPTIVLEARDTPQTVVVDDRAPRTVVVDERDDPLVTSASSLPPVVVEHYDGARVVADCEPPNSAPECAYYHQLLRENFSPHELALLFGPATAQPDYRTSYSFAREHYAAFLQDIAENGLPVPRPVAVEYDDD